MLGFDIAGYVLFALVTSITPGPNNYLLFSYGKKYGLKDSGKLMLGISLGFSVLLYITGYGIGKIINENKTIAIIFKVICSLWLFYLAIILSKIQSKGTENNVVKAGFYHGFLMQFVNPKAWIMAISSAGAFLPHLSNIHLSVFVYTVLFALVGAPCMISWVTFGDAISKIITSEKSNKTVGISLFVLIISSIVMIWL